MQCKRLHSVAFHSVAFSNDVVRKLAACRSITSLDMSSSFTAEQLSILLHSKSNINSLIINWKLPDDIRHVILAYSLLNELHYFCNPMDDLLVCSHLYSLTISHGPSHPSVLAQLLQQNKHLVQLKLLFTLSLELCMVLVQAKQVQLLTLAGDLSVPVFQALGRCTSLHLLDIASCRQAPYDMLDTLCELPHLTALNTSYPLSQHLQRTLKQNKTCALIQRQFCTMHHNTYRDIKFLFTVHDDLMEMEVE